MNARDAEQRWAEFWGRTHEALRHQKLLEASLGRLSGYYLSLELEERAVIDELLCRWVLADDESRQFDALSLIAEHRITLARPALTELAHRLDSASDPSAPFTKAKVERIVALLS